MNRMNPDRMRITGDANQPFSWQNRAKPSASYAAHKRREPVAVRTRPNGVIEMPMGLTVVVFAAIILFSIFMVFGDFTSDAVNIADREEIVNQIGRLREKKEELRIVVDNEKNEDVIKMNASIKLGMIEPERESYVVLSGIRIDTLDGAQTAEANVNSR